MGPIVEGEFRSLILRPFQSSVTFRNLAATRCGVFHVVDQVDLIAKAAIGRLKEWPEVERATSVDGFVLKNCCRWFEFTVDAVEVSDARSQMPSTIVHCGERRAFCGFNRARHAVIEAAILATRLHLLPKSEILANFAWLQSAVVKTGGESELAAFQMLHDFVLNHDEKVTS
jgi:hypothetical protein